MYSLNASFGTVSMSGLQSVGDRGL
jgi:hypothetical protein